MYVRLGLANPKEGMTEERFKFKNLETSYTSLRSGKWTSGCSYL